MKYIKKQEEPKSFALWKQMINEDWQPSWNNLRDDVNRSDFKPKTALYEALLCEQGYICCYCGRRINRYSSHIEHFKPRQSYPELSLDYSNLVASCPGYLEEEDLKALTELKAPQEYCGQRKGNWYDSQLTVSPLISDCEDYFRYTGFGEILPASDPNRKLASQETIQRLGLNHSKLETARRRVVEEILPIIDDLSMEEITKLIQSYEQLDGEGKYVRFCAVVLHFLKRES